MWAVESDPVGSYHLTPVSSLIITLALCLDDEVLSRGQLLERALDQSMVEEVNETKTGLQN